jgi:choline dehydrogenase-like flavoprotein
LTGAHVSKITFREPNDTSLLFADGVEFLKDGKAWVVKVSREVILSAGSFHTPAILELSGETYTCELVSITE